MISYRHLVFAILVTLTVTVACKKTEPTQEVQLTVDPQPKIEEQTNQIALSKEELELKEYKSCEDTFQSITYQPTIEFLEKSQESLRCVENFLSRHSDTTYRNQVYLLRAKIVQSVMRGIEEHKNTDVKEGDDLSTMQNHRLSAEKLKKIKSENYSFIRRAIEETTISIYHDIFLELRDQGVKLGDPKLSIEQGNRMAKQTGVWESTIDEERDGGKFVVKRWVTEKVPMFVIEGVGGISPVVQIEDPVLETEGYFSKNCFVYLGIGSERYPFACFDFIKGSLSESVKAKVIADIKHDMKQR